jgi:hypothetical protein
MMRLMIVSVLFRLINVGVLIAVFIYGYRKYAKKPLIDDMLHAHKALEGLEHALDGAKKNRHVQEQQLRDDAQLISTLKEKIVLWRMVQHRLLMEREEYKARRSEQLRAQQPHKQQRIAEYMAERSGMDDIIEQSRQMLTNRFEQAGSVRRYSDTVISILERESTPDECR